MISSDVDKEGDTVAKSTRCWTPSQQRTSNFYVRASMEIESFGNLSPTLHTLMFTRAIASHYFLSNAEPRLATYGDNKDYDQLSMSREAAALSLISPSHSQRQS